jgi:hypothetical protein
MVGFTLNRVPQQRQKKQSKSSWQCWIEAWLAAVSPVGLTNVNCSLVSLLCLCQEQMQRETPMGSQQHSPAYYKSFLQEIAHK